MKTTEAHKRIFSGEVVSTAMNKTIVVRVDSVKTHPKYGKQYTRSKKYHVHDEKGVSVVGTVVNFIECRPLSKTKRWRILTA
jgi:small subunit ribosomal protein S17